jgi:hypothetical protein
LAGSATSRGPGKRFFAAAATPHHEIRFQTKRQFDCLANVRLIINM